MLTPEEFKTRRLWRFWDRAGLGWIVWFWDGSCSVLGLDFVGAYCIFNNLCEIFGSLWIYEIYVDLLVRGINRVERYIRSKYILTDVIEKRNAVKRSIN